jgi:hypothetical protein
MDETYKVNEESEEGGLIVDFPFLKTEGVLVSHYPPKRFELTRLTAEDIIFCHLC